MKRRDLEGQTFGRLLVKGVHGKDKQGRLVWGCLCGCGILIEVKSWRLVSGKTKSCGCLRREVAAINGKVSGTHLMHKSSTYKVWANMKSRCFNPKEASYPHYGGRGITVCERWLKFENFLADMGEKPEELSLDRFPDNDGDYEPGNCRWATITEQSNNRRTNVVLECDGVKMTKTEWARSIGISFESLSKRIRRWGLYRALTTPKVA